MAVNKETLGRLVAELQLLEGAAEELQSRINLVDAAITELRLCGATLEGLKTEREGSPLFVPIGGGSYVKAKVDDASKVIIGIGAGVAVEKTTDEAKETIGNQLADLEKVRASLQQQLLQVAQRMDDTRTKVSELSRKLSEEKRGK